MTPAEASLKGVDRPPAIKERTTKKRIEQLFVVSKAQHRGHLAVAQRVRDQINRAYGDVPPNAQPCLDRVLEWLDREDLQQRQQAD
jgi:hypothetical protein